MQDVLMIKGRPYLNHQKRGQFPAFSPVQSVLAAFCQVPCLFIIYRRHSARVHMIVNLCCSFPTSSPTAEGRVRKSCLTPVVSSWSSALRPSPSRVVRISFTEAGPSGSWRIFAPTQSNLTVEPMGGAEWAWAGRGPRA